MANDIFDNKTKNLGLPLPNVRNKLANDCPRIAESLTIVDEHIGNLKEGAKADGIAIVGLQKRASALEEVDEEHNQQISSLAEALASNEEARIEADKLLGEKIENDIAAAASEINDEYGPRVASLEDDAAALKSRATILEQKACVVAAWNTEATITESGEWIAPASTWFEVTCIGGGGAGGSQARVDATMGCGGLGGGNTSFGEFVTARGGGGGGGGGTAAGSGGGAAGEVVKKSLWLNSGETVSLVIGGGGVIQTVDGAQATGWKCGRSHSDICKPGQAAQGAGGGTPDDHNDNMGVGGNGGYNGTPYGGGGAGSGGGVNYGRYGLGGFGGGNGEDAGPVPTTGTRKSGCDGGNGGPGAIIIRWFDPALYFGPAPVEQGDPLEPDDATDNAE